MGRCLWVVVVVAVAVVPFVDAICNRIPPGTTAPKREGDNGYSIKISGDPPKYFPGEVYTVSLTGQRLEYNVQRFRAFLLLVEATDTPLHIYGPHSVGTFQLFGDALTMHSDDCRNAITHTSAVTKTEVQVLWTAPPAGSGCVRFRATVVESRDVWFMDDGELTKELCEDVQESPDTQPPVIHDCFACDEAKYEVTFEGLWSRQTHPKGFPTNEWTTHFSDIIGASHSADYRVWENGEYASEGLKQVAELGSPRALESELKRQSDHIRTIIKARGLWYPNVNGKTFAVFRVDNKHHLMSLVSMLGPSPDWIVGVSALELCLSNRTWVRQKELNLYPYDAGTDSGITYESIKQPSIPRERIRPIRTGEIKDARSPFYDSTGQRMKPLAKLTITRQRVYEKSCSDNQPFDIGSEEEDYPETSDQDSDRPECAVTEWSEFTACSATCGKGLRQRSRNYRIPMKAQMMDCNRQLMEKEMCIAEVPYCEGENVPWAREFDERVCLTSSWSPWTPCSATCGTGLRMRNRHYLDRMGRKKCTEELVEKQMCVADVPHCDSRDEEIIPPECQVTAWTDFSPCSATCGQGTRARTRSYLVPFNHEQCNVNTLEQIPCQEAECSIDPAQAEEVCMLEKEVGPCRARFLRFYFDKNRQRCMEFNYGGCKGNRNNFETYDECNRVCQFHSRPTPPEDLPPPASASHRLYPPSPPLPIPDGGDAGGGRRVNCRVTPWSDWGPCTATCGLAYKFKERMIKMEPQNGGRKCPRLQKRKKCKKNPPCPTNAFGGLVSRSLHRDPTPGANTSHHTPTTLPPPYRPPTPNPQQPYESHDFIAPALFNPPISYNGGGGDRPSFPDLEQGPSVDCEMSDWGPWSPCTHSCGPESLQQRSRRVLVEARGGGIRCGDRNQRRYCNLMPCPRTSHRYQREPWNSGEGNSWQP